MTSLTLTVTLCTSAAGDWQSWNSVSREPVWIRREGKGKVSVAEPVQSLREDFCSEGVVTLGLLYFPVMGIHSLGRGDK